MVPASSDNGSSILTYFVLLKLLLDLVLFSKSMTFYLFFYLIFLICEKYEGFSASESKDELRYGCSRNITVNWWDLPPYVYRDKNEIKGTFKIILERLIHKCCGKHVTFIYTNPKHSAESVKKSVLKADISYPLYAGMKINELEQRPFFPVIESPGLIYLRTVATKKDNDLGEAVFNKALEAWPVLILTLIMAAISGIVIWALESYWNPDEFPVTFLKGAWEGFWWAFVSMTTVGYGDKAPRSTFGRIFTLCWVLIGLVIISIFTATVTTSLTALSLSNDVTLYGKNLVSLKRTEEFSYGVRNNNNMQSTNSIDEFVDLVKNQIDDKDNPIHGGLLDAYRAGFVSDKLSESNGIKFATVVDHQFVYGFVVSRNLMNASLHTCLRRTLSMDENLITSIIQRDMVPLAKPAKSKADETSSNLFDAKSTMFQHTIFVCLGIIGTLTFSGFLWEYYYYRPKQKELSKTNEKTEDDVVAIETTPTSSYEEILKTQCRLFEETMIEEVLSFHRTFQMQLDGIKHQSSCRKIINDKPSDFELSTFHSFNSVDGNLSTSNIYK